MSIWFARPDPDEINRRSEGTLVARLGIRCVAVGADSLSATMPVDERTRQPHGILHGGASLALAETAGSIAGSLCVDPDRETVVGVEINANHLHAVHAGEVHATARPRHLGRRIQVWEIELSDDAGRTVCVSRLTLAVVSKAPRAHGGG